jgi:uncharacterized protein (DUF2147 family)
VALALPRNVEASPVDGAWSIRGLALHIFDCQRLVCGQIIWAGWIVDPNDDKTYRLSAVYEPDGTMRARIFKGIPLIGKTEVLTRVDLRSLTGLC